MHPERWQQATRLFHEALDRPPAERRAFLDGCCAADPQLRDEVVSLLAAHEAAGDFIETPAIAAAPEALFEQHVIAEGDRLGPFTIERLIARGGMGVVYLALDTRLDRRVALKLVPPELAHDAELRERLSREAQAAATLSHPSIAQVFALEEIGARLVIVSEFVEGRTLRAEMRGAPLPLADVYATGIELVEAVVAAHARGIVHRDLKPDNIMRTQDGRLKVLDFGLARFLSGHERAELTRLTATGIAIGTPGYMSPEQRQGGEVDARTDIYALGVLLSEMATGRLPSEAAGQMALVDLSSQAPRLTAIIRRSGAIDPQDRYATADALLNDLRQARGEILSGSARSAVWWWGVHQLVVMVLYGACLAGAWWVKREAIGAAGDAVFFATLIAAAAGWTLRLHLAFVARFDPPGFGAATDRAAAWTRAGDILMAASLLGASALVPGSSVAPALTAAGLALVVATLVVEPASTREAVKAVGPRL